MSNNNNNNNNNNENQTEQERNYPYAVLTKGKSVQIPDESDMEIKNEIANNYRKLYSFLKTSTLKDIKEFLNQFYICLLNTEGYKNKEITITKELHSEIMPKYNDTKCFFLGNLINKNKGCKVESTPEKLTAYVEHMMKFLIYFFKYNVTEDTKQAMLKDEETMNLLEKAIRNLFYFFGQKQISPPFKSANTLFSSFVDQMNALFGGFRILRLTCPKEEYGCGRFVTINKCNTSGQYYVIIHKTGGDDNRTVAINIGEISNKERSSCGGAKKTKRSPKKRKIRKIRKTRKI